MTKNSPQPGIATTRQGRSCSAMVCRCSSASTSFMLAALRVLHVDPSHAPAGIAWTKEQPFLDPAQRDTAVSLIQAPKQPDQGNEEAAARGVTCARTMSSNGIQHLKPRSFP